MSTKTTPVVDMSIKAIRGRIGLQWYTLNSLAHERGSASELYSWIQELESEEIQAERDHRAMGRRWTDGRASSPLSMTDAAKRQALRNIGRRLDRGRGRPRKLTALEAANMPRRVLLAMAIAEACRPKLRAAGIGENLGESDQIGFIVRDAA